MEALGLLKHYWRDGAHGPAARRRTTISTHADSATTTTVTAAETDDDNNDEGPFFDLEFSAEDEESQNAEERRGKESQGNGSEQSDDSDDDGGGSSGDDIEDEEEEFDFAVCSSPADDRPDPNQPDRSPFEDLFFKGSRLVSVDPNSSLQPKSPQISVPLQKSPTKFRVLLLKFKKSKLSAAEEEEAKKKPEEEEDDDEDDDGEEGSKDKRSKFLAVKLKSEPVPIVSFFTNGKSEKRPAGDESASDEKKFSKEVMHKYLKKVKPLYVKVSRRYGEKLGFSGPLSSAIAPPPTAAKKKLSPETNEIKQEKQGSNALGKLRVVKERLGKSRSVVAAAPSTPASWRRRDDSLLQVEDGIQSAILHCKRSFNGGSRDSTILPAWISEEEESENEEAVE